MARPRALLTCGFLFLAAWAALAADTNTSQSQTALSIHPVSTSSRFDIIRGLNAEFVFVRKPFPMGVKGLALKNGVVTPNDDVVRSLIAQYGPAARPGDRAQITDVIFKDSSIIFELNGGPKKKKKWYQHIEIGSNGGSTPIAPDNSPQNPHGSFVVLQFDKFVPEITPQQVKKMLAPVFDFTALSATEAYADIMPPKVRDAMKKHEVLVGMNREMVNYSLGRPEQKVREHDDLGSYEEWIYGHPPQDVQFVRIYGDEVKRVEIMKVDGTKQVRTEPEMAFIPSGMGPSASGPAVAQAGATAPNGGPSATVGGGPRPTLRLPGEAAPASDSASGIAPVIPADSNPPPPTNAPPPQ